MKLLDLLVLEDTCENVRESEFNHSCRTPPGRNPTHGRLYNIDC